jgi:Alpha galactosidase A/Alpha galactosidase C-terminal beta sandwich domain
MDTRAVVVDGQKIAELARMLAIACILVLNHKAAGETPAQTMPVAPPPMGWSSWNSFSNTVNSQVVMSQAEAMVKNGMQKAGYQYVNIDEGWWLGERDAQGNIVVDPASWTALAPGEHAGDMSNIVRFIQNLGLKAGIYTDAGADGCSMSPDLGPKYFHTGSEGHYDQDFLQFAQWGFDYVKVDWCGGDKENLDPAVQYGAIAKSIARAERLTGHRMYFSICDWGKNSPWTWAPNISGSPADIWRTSGDIVDPIVAGHEHAERKVNFAQMLSNFDQGIHPEAQHTGYYNDPDMMVLGMPGLSDEENRLHMSLWAISGAPLLVGADLTKLSSASMAILTNATVIAIDQDTLGLQAMKAASPEPGLEIWSKMLVPAGRRAILLLNRTKAPADLTVQSKDLGLDASRPVHVKDIWAGNDLSGFQESHSYHLAPGDFLLLQIEGTDDKEKIYDATSADAGSGPKKGNREEEGKSLVFHNVTSTHRVAAVRVTYSNSGNLPHFAELRVNDQAVTRVALPPTPAAKLGQVWIQVVLDRAAQGNEFVFSEGCGKLPKILSIAVR